MLKEKAHFFNKIAVAADAGILALALFLACSSRLQLGHEEDLSRCLWVFLVSCPIWYFFLARYQLYASIRKLSLFEIVTTLINVHLFSGGVLAAAMFIFDPAGFSRVFFFTYVGLCFLLLTLEKVLLRYLLGAARKKGFNTRNLLIVGTRAKAQKLYRLVEEHADWGLNILGFVYILTPDPEVNLEGKKVLGRIEDLVRICKDNPVDEVVFCPPKDYIIDADEHLKDLEELGITVRMVLDFYDVKKSRREFSLLSGELPMLTFHSRNFDQGQLLLKRLLDIAGALAGLLITALLFPFIAYAIKKDSPGPLLFGQDRVGESGRIFKCWKFRSMYIDAEERKKELMASNEMQGAMFKMKDDPRITKVGHFIRKTSLDELPQFWNVLKGEMSLVGTRPPTPAEVAQYENWHRRRISIKPGITGNWQVSGRSEIKDFDTVVRLDLDYIDHWSIWLDIRILFKTLKVIFIREGSC